MSTTTSNLGLFKYDVNTDTNVPFSITEALNNNWDIIDEKCNGGGLEICDIGIALYVDETKGLRRRLNGSIMDITSNYQAFLTRLKEITTLYPSLVCTESEWQTTKTMSKLGQCGKFVYNYGADGTTVTSIRLPLVININGLVDMSNAGLVKDESLPNIKGTTVSGCPVVDVNKITNEGAFKLTTGYITGWGGGAAATANVNFDASRSSSTYKNNAPVQQEAIQYPYFIQIATGSETENNIINEIELNNPFTFGMSQYYKGEMKNLSWLKSNGQENFKSGHPDFYNWVLTNANAGKEGFKLSTATDITDYDFVVNPTKETFRLPLKNGMEGVFASGVKGNGKALVVTDGNGNERNLFQPGNDYIFTNDNVAGNLPHVTASYNGNQKTSYALGTNVGLTTDFTKSGIVVDTTVPSGWNLYFYVGETVQNANLIDAGRIGEQLANKQDKCIHIIDTYVNGTSGYRIWSDGYCEQWGSVATNVIVNRVTLLKKYKDTNYNVVSVGGSTITNKGSNTAINNKTQNSFSCEYWTYNWQVPSSDLYCMWKASGYLAEGEY